MRGREISRARQTFQSGVLLHPNFHLSAQKFPPFGAAAVSSFCLSIISHLHLVSPYLLLTVAFFATHSWEYFSHDDARSRAYRWGEDGLLGITDRECRLCFALALWNGKDPILKERLYGLTGPQGKLIIFATFESCLWLPVLNYDNHHFIISLFHQNFSQ